MKYFPLIWAGLWRKPIRTVLTFLSIVVAFILFGMLHGVTAGFDDIIDQMSDTRIRVQSRGGIFQGLPTAHVRQIEQIENVDDAGYLAIFPSYYQEETKPIAAAGIQVTGFSPIFPDVILSEDDIAKVAKNRRGAIVGNDLAEKHGWAIGDTVTLTSQFFSKEDGSRDWTFEIEAIARFKEDLPANELWFHYEYLDEARAQSKGMAHIFFATFSDPEMSATISSEIDRRFENTSHPTVSQNEKDWIRGRVEEIGNINFFVGGVIGSVLFTLLFLTGNTMIQSVRERIPELAVMKTYGFGNGLVLTIVFVESAVLCVLAAGVGLWLTSMLFPTLFEATPIGRIELPFAVIRDGVLMALLLALISSAAPAYQAQRLKIVDALAGR